MRIIIILFAKSEVISTLDIYAGKCSLKDSCLKTY